MLTGIVVGAVVAIVSAVVTYIAGLKMQRDRWCREDQITSRDRAIELKRAARLISAELLRFQVAAGNFVETKDWYSVAELTTEAWKNHRDIIAPGLSDSDWSAVLIAVQAAENLLTLKGMVPGNQTVDISEGTSEVILRILRDIEAGRSSLAPYVRDTPPTSGNAAINP